MKADVGDSVPADGGWDESALADDLACFAPESLIACDALGRVRLWNPASEALYGIDAVDALGRDLDELLATRHPFGLDSVRDELRRGGSWSGELYRRAADGRELRVEAAWRVRRDAAGRFTGIIERGRDQTAEDVTRRESEAAAHRYRNLFHAMAASFWELDFSGVRAKIGGLLQSGVTDLRGYFEANPAFVDECIAATIILDVNETTVEMFGAPSCESVMGEPLGWEWPQESRHVYAAALVAAFERQDKFMTEVRLARWDGSLMDALFTVCWPSEHKARGSVLVGVIDISAMKCMERDLRASEERYRNLFEFLPIAVWRMDGSAMKAKLQDLRAAGETSLLPYAAANPDFRVGDHLQVVEANSATAELFGLESSAQAKGPLTRFWAGTESALAITEQRMQGSKYVQSEARLRRLDGSEFHALVTVGFPDALASDSVNLVAAVDISDRVEAFRQLEESESRYRTLYNQMPIGLIQLDNSRQLAWYRELKASGVEDIQAYFDAHPEAYGYVADLVRISSANREAVRLLGAADETDLIDSVRSIWSADPKGLEGVIRARLRGDPAFSTESRFVRRDGGVIDAMFTIAFTPELDARGISVVGFFDVTAQKQAVASLAESESRYRSLFEFMPMGICELDTSAQLARLKELRDRGVDDVVGYVRDHPEFAVELSNLTTIRSANSAAAKLLEASSPEELIGPIAPLWLDAPGVLQRVAVARAAGKSSFQSDVPGRTLKGNRLDALVTIAFPPELDARGTSVVGFIDIGEQRRANLALAASERRFQDLFEKMPLAMLELDSSRMVERLGTLTASGIEDVGAWLREDPARIEELGALHRVAGANAEALRLFEAGRIEDMFVPVTSFWEGGDTFRRSVEARLRGEASYAEETRLISLGGNAFDALYTIAFTEDAEGRAVSLVGLTDIGDLKRAIADLETSEARFRNLFENMPVALSQLDMRELQLWLAGFRLEPAELADHLEANPDLSAEIARRVRIVESNNEAVRLFGAGSAEQVHQTIEPFWRIRPDTILRSTVARLRGAEAFSEETQIVTQRGELVEVLYTIGYPAALVERGMNIVGFVDLSERTRASTALRLSETRYRDLFQQIPVGLWRLDPHPIGRLFGELKAKGVVDLAEHFDSHPETLVECMRALSIIEVNAAAARIAGLDAAELIGMNCADFWRDNPEIFRNSMLARWRGQLGHAEEGVMGTPANGTIDVAFSVTFPDPARSDDASVVSTIDVGDRKRAEERLQRVQADFSHAARVSTLGELAASIAHEVNQPLAAISAFAQASLRWLARERLNVEELRSLSEQIVDDAQRASEVIARIRRMAVKRDPTFEAVDLNGLVEEALLIVRHEAASRSVKLQTRLATGLPPAFGDRIQLQQVVVNLALNAAQAMDDAGCDRRVVTVSTSLGDGTLVVRVGDTGPGIGVGVIDHLFTGFFTTKQNGMGMGLAICRSIIEAHGGFINASNAQGGAVFEFTLPLGGAAR